MTTEATIPAAVAKAAEYAHALARRAWTFVEPDGVTGRRWFLIGDPQTSFARFAGYLHDAGLLGEEGFLAHVDRWFGTLLEPGSR